MHELPANDAAAVPLLEVGVALGQSEALGTMAGRCTAAQAAALKRLRDSKTYQRLNPTWRDFCTIHLRMSGAHADNIIRAYEQFGESYFEMMRYARISPDSYRDVQPLLKDGALEVEGERIEFAPENAARIRDAVAEARRHARDRRKPGSLDFLLDNLEKRVDQLIQDLRAIAPRAYNETRWRRFRGVLQFLCEQVAELRAEHRINEVSCQFQNIAKQPGRRQ